MNFIFKEETFKEYFLSPHSSHFSRGKCYHQNLKWEGRICQYYKDNFNEYFKPVWFNHRNSVIYFCGFNPLVGVNVTLTTLNRKEDPVSHNFKERLLIYFQLYSDVQVITIYLN